MQDRLLTYAADCTVALLVLFSGCAGRERAINVTTGASDQKVQVEMKARNFAFDPDVIVAHKGDTLVLNITDVSGETHNITVKDPSGAILKREDIPARKTITVEVPLQTTGVYPFYCDRPFHSTLGMKGRIEVK
jgi:plastocyanin